MPVNNFEFDINNYSKEDLNQFSDLLYCLYLDERLDEYDRKLSKIYEMTESELSIFEIKIKSVQMLRQIPAQIADAILEYSHGTPGSMSCNPFNFSF